MPKVSVLMGAYNAAQTVHQAIESILQQSFQDWEFIIVEDGSTDSTWLELQRYSSDKRFKLVKNSQNIGLAGSLNRGFKEAVGEFIARQDADDTSTPDRFQKQLDYFSKYPETDVLSTNAFLVDRSGVWGENIRAEIPRLKDWAKGSQIIHASAMIRKSILLKAGGYDQRALRVEDYDLWMRIISLGGCIRTIQEKLYCIQWGADDYRRKRYADRFREMKYKIKGIKILGLGPGSYIYVLKSLLILAVPTQFLIFYHRMKMKN